MFIVLVGMIIYLKKTGTQEYAKKNEVLDNDVNFSGHVIAVKQSNNHAFGIIILKIIQSNVNNFNDKLKNSIYPYRIQENIAELYTIIPDGIQEGDIVNLKSKEKNSHFYYVKTKQKSEGYIWVITEPLDIDFVKENTIFK